jgi:hypothetical protein
MPKIKTISNSIFFTVSSLETVEKTAKYLLGLCQQAYMERDFSELLIQAEKLLQLTPKHQKYGEFYKAQALSNLGKTAIATAIHEGLTESAVTKIRAASLLALGLREFRNEKYEHAVKLVSQASRFALSESICAPITVIRAHTIMAAFYGIHGDGQRSIEMLDSVEPLVKIVGRYAPMMLGQHLNAKAYEISQTGNRNCALHLSKKAISLSISAKYPEWLETYQEIEQSLIPLGTSIVAPQNYSRSELLGNVIHFPVPKNCFQINFTTPKTNHIILDFAVNGTTESEARFDALISVFDSLCTKEQTDYQIEGKLVGDDYRYKNNLRKSMIREFLKVIKNVKQFEAANPLPPEKKQPKEETARNKVVWLNPKLENSK